MYNFSLEVDGKRGWMQFLVEYRPNYTLILWKIPGRNHQKSSRSICVIETQCDSVVDLLNA